MEKYNEFKYKVISETKDGKTKQLYWNIAFGLQDVDNIKPSEYMLQLAKENVEGKKTYTEVYKQIDSYYKESTHINSDEREADIVSARIVQMLSSPTFRFDYNTLKLYHKHLFDGVDILVSQKYIGKWPKLLHQKRRVPVLPVYL